MPCVQYLLRPDVHVEADVVFLRCHSQRLDEWNQARSNGVVASGPEVQTSRSGQSSKSNNSFSNVSRIPICGSKSVRSAIRVQRIQPSPSPDLHPITPLYTAASTPTLSQAMSLRNHLRYIASMS